MEGPVQVNREIIADGSEETIFYPYDLSLMLRWYSKIQPAYGHTGKKLSDIKTCPRGIVGVPSDYEGAYIALCDSCRSFTAIMTRM